MTKQSGLGWTTLTLDDAGGTPRSIINDVSNMTMSFPRATQDVTGMDKLAFERLLLLADCSGQLNAPAFNPGATTGFHQVCKTIPSSSVVRTLAIAIASQSISNEVICTDYQLSRAADGSFPATVPYVLADGTLPAWS